MSNAPESVLVGSLQKFSVEDGPGIRTTVFLKGCPLSCKWCHNPELIDPQQQLIKSPNNCIGCGCCVKICPKGAVTINPEEGVVIDRAKCDVCLQCTDECYAQALRPVAKRMSIDEILRVAEQDKGFYENTGGGITVSGGEILMHADFVCRLIDEAGKRGINMCLDTCGFGDSQALMKMALKENVTDILYDMKSIDDEVHRQYTGVSNQLILDNLRMLAADARTADKLIMRMPLIRGVNDSGDIIKRTGELYREIGVKRVNLLPYHSLGISKKRNVGGTQEDFQQPAEERLTEIGTYFKNEINLKVEILGRV
ncbi:glycyl-radical enzyme activating protein [Aminipila luticellarii]|uniref:Glycyl-radical enzyme activating protein n=1 Tax=Aminipila luticellarii TaxID=2507160 RepID=A0A410PXD8_9FIRM|nr:glycyl-radical enzyme activating protein [Aminipila luticellarii]QAT43608.1 glycyl-radical enzyme activating protein [Aminipila luticellarii]